MKKFILNLLIFAAILVVCDCVLGKVFDLMAANVKGGDTQVDNIICDELEDEVLVFGSSRAMHHYDPFILQDSLHRSCYNCGFDGARIILTYGRWKMINQRYTPKMVVLEVTPGYDLLVDDNHAALTFLRRHYDRPSIDSICWDVDYTERYKNISQCFRYNSFPIKLLVECIHPLRTVEKGYQPKDKQMLYEPIVSSSDAEKVYEYDPLKLYYLERFIRECSGKAQLIMCASPLYRNTSDDVYQPVKEMAEKYGIPFLNHYCDSTFNFNKAYFYDSSLMNRSGATRYSEIIAHGVKQVLDTH